MELNAIGSVAANSTQRTVNSSPSSTVPVSTPTSQTTVQTESAVQQSATPPSMSQVKQAVDEINKSMQSLSRGLVFSVDEDSQKTVVKVVDQKTREVIRQIPTEEALAISQSLDQAIGKLIQQKA